MHYSDVLIIGAGAAGLTAAIFAASAGEPPDSGTKTPTGSLSGSPTGSLSGSQTGSLSWSPTGPPKSRKVILLERTPQPGRKILMSGGTRCNVLPVTVRLDDFVTESSRNRMRNVFRSWSVDACRQWFEDEIGLRLACETESNKWFPVSNSAREVRDRLVRKAIGLGVDIRTGSSVASVRRSGGMWTVSTDDGVHFGAPVVIFATGGLSIPSTGTDGTGHSIAETLGHTLHPAYPALTPLKGPHPGNEPLPGVSLDVDLEPVFVDMAVSGSNVLDTASDLTHANIHPVPKERCPFRTRRSGFLFTHQGCSGPAVLDVSHVIVRELENTPPEQKALRTAALRINWTGKPAAWWQGQLEGRHTTTSLLRSHLPRRLADNLLEENGLADRKTAQLSAKERRRLIADLTAYLLIPTGHLGYKKAEVTGGGVPLDEINPATMESRIAPGLFLCGEILDVFGRIGGFNFYWAWVSGRLAGIHAASAAVREDQNP